jgi:hypothetical protein
VSTSAKTASAGEEQRQASRVKINITKQGVTMTAGAW